ncbi:MAG: hypothetical protein M3T49_02790 [Candidatus Eremiobacteraeota bacterium]|nr:hypothetical protein [Candidatus Eremiobacteraeota bacterium]
MTAKSAWLIGGTGLAALALWPVLMLGHVGRSTAALAGPPTPAPVIADYVDRNRVVNFYERAVGRDRADQIMPRMLASQYLQRFREMGDVGDLLRAQNMAQLSLRKQPRYNVAAESELSSVALTFHDMRTALRYARDAADLQAGKPGSDAPVASLDMELGWYAQAGNILHRRAPPQFDDAGWDAVAAHYAELTGNLAGARTLMARGMAQEDSVVDNPAENRAWYHWRAGQLAFKAGDLDAAESDYRAALALYPKYARAFDSLAQLYEAELRWRDALAAATAGADLIPLPVTLGYKADAQRALGDADGAAQTSDLIVTEERLGNVRGINDRLIANYYADHRMRPDDAIAIARRDLAKRDDIYSEDTLGWALAAAGRWPEARVHAERAVRYGTQDSLLQYHAGIIELHSGARAAALGRLDMALRLNPKFHPVYADDARRLLQTADSR